MSNLYLPGWVCMHRADKDNNNPATWRRSEDIREVSADAFGGGRSVVIGIGFSLDVTESTTEIVERIMMAEHGLLNTAREA